MYIYNMVSAHTCRCLKCQCIGKSLHPPVNRHPKIWPCLAPKSWVTIIFFKLFFQAHAKWMVLGNLVISCYSLVAQFIVFLSMTRSFFLLTSDTWLQSLLLLLYLLGRFWRHHGSCVVLRDDARFASVKMALTSFMINSFCSWSLQQKDVKA